MIDKSTLVSGLLDYLFIVIFCLIGAIIKDTYNTFTNKDNKVKLTRILISTFFSSIIIFSLSDYIMSMINWKLFILPCFISGMVGFELLGKINKLGFWIKVIMNNKDKIKESILNNMDDKGNDSS